MPSTFIQPNCQRSRRINGTALAAANLSYPIGMSKKAMFQPFDTAETLTFSDTGLSFANRISSRFHPKGKERNYLNSPWFVNGTFLSPF
jgi:hypothetical protein